MFLYLSRFLEGLFFLVVLLPAVASAIRQDRHRAFRERGNSIDRGAERRSEFAPCASGDSHFAIYRDSLLSGVCSLPLSHTDRQLTCRGKLECILNDFHASKCGGITEWPGDVCEVCTSETTMKNSTVGGHEYVKVNGTYFYEYRKHFEETYSSNSEYLKVVQHSVRGKQLACAAMVMVKDQCGKTYTPSCNSWDVEGWRRVYNGTAA